MVGENLEIADKFAADVAAAADLPDAEIRDMIETPPDPQMGDLALPCFKLAKTMRRSPRDIAAGLAEKIGTPDYADRVAVEGGYLNIYVRPEAYVETVLLPAAEAGTEWGKSDEGQGRTVVIDYSSINIAKPFHIGHLSSTAIGSALYKIYGYLGYNVVGVNHLGDWGTQFGKMIAAYKHWGSDEEIEKGGVDALMQLYVRFHTEAEADDSLNEEGRMWFRRIEEGDEEAVRIFGWFKDLTLREAAGVYEKLDVKFDSYAGESFYESMLPAVIAELREKNLLEESEGAEIVRLDEYDLSPMIVLKSDGATLYATRDLAAAEYRKRTYDFDRNLYVVAYQQNLHFRQLFAALEKMGYEWARDCEHVAFGMVSLEDQTLSTRHGNVVLLKDVLNRAVEKTIEIIDQKNPGLENKEEIAAQIGIGAVLYSALSQSRIKDITFNWDRVLNFDGETGPYVQYAHTRCVSVLGRAGEIGAEPDFRVLDNPQAVAVMKLIGQFPEAVKLAAERNEPFYVTRSITELAQAFNRYYYDHKIITPDDPAATAARLVLTRVVRDVLRRGLALLGIRAPEKM
ncbi:MAG: arginine--tRNA ligase [Clostridia bacterium]|nr:arginine--tRNA ligase [Clostridia bacterium]